MQLAYRLIRLRCSPSGTQSTEIAPTGQFAAQVPHSMQLSALMTYLPLPSEIASAGQLAAQVPHMTQSSLITKAIVVTSYVFHRVSLPLV